MGDIPVIARLVYSDGTEVWQPARANRWTRTQVLVIWLRDPSSPLSTELCWLAVQDVTQVIAGRTGELAVAWATLRRFSSSRPGSPHRLSDAEVGE